MSYVFDKVFFHYVVSEGITYLCMAEEAFGRRIPFAFLDDIKNRFKSTYGDRGRSAIAYAMQSDFSRVLQKQMEYYSNDANADKITGLKKGLEDVKGIMTQNIERVLERGERIELLVEKTDTLTSESATFKKKSTELKNTMWWQNIKLWIAVGVILIIVIYIIVAVACGGPALPNCVPHSSPPPPTPTPTPVPQPAPALSLKFIKNI